MRYHDTILHEIGANSIIKRNYIVYWKGSRGGDASDVGPTGAIGSPGPKGLRGEVGPAGVQGEGR